MSNIELNILVIHLIIIGFLQGALSNNFKDIITGSSK